MENSVEIDMRCDVRKKVAIVYRFLPQYRAAFFDGLKARLGEEGIDLQLFYGKSKLDLKREEVDLSWGRIVSQAELNLLGKKLVFQHLPDSIYESSLIILMQENCILSNFAVALRARRRGVRVALWGHGINFQDKANSVANWFKRQYSCKVDWWFAYTSKVAELVKAMAYPQDRITILNNAIDTQGLMAGLALITERQKDDLRKELNIGTGPVGIYCGGMYPEKRLSFLLEAAEAVRRVVPQFELIMIGAGPDARLAIEFAATHDWVHYVGPKYGAERVPYFALSGVFLMPGLVGLAALDSFALGTPLITTNVSFHSPEIEYIENGINGLISQDDIPDYVRTVIDAVVDSSSLTALRENARRSAAKYTVEAMVSNFAGGVLEAIEAPLAREDRTKWLS